MNSTSLKPSLVQVLSKEIHLGFIISKRTHLRFILIQENLVWHSTKEKETTRQNTITKTKNRNKKFSKTQPSFLTTATNQITANGEPIGPNSKVLGSKSTTVLEFSLQRNMLTIFLLELKMLGAPQVPKNGTLKNF